MRHFFREIIKILIRNRAALVVYNIKIVYYSLKKQYKLTKKLIVMTKIYTKGAYSAPVMKSLSVSCEEGFAQSLAIDGAIDGLTPMDGAWDDEAAF